MDSVNFEEMRRAMVDSQLRTSGVQDPIVLAAMGTIAREDYVPASHRATAYMDRSLLTAAGDILNPAVSTALLLQAAGIKETDNVLLIGKADGYVAAILKTSVTDLMAVSADDLGSASHGAPYSLIVVDGAAEELPEALLKLAANGARIVTGVLEGAVTRLAKGHVHDGKVALKTFIDSEIAPIEAFARKAEFVF